jgi:two-component sensor histidine kinase
MAMIICINLNSQIVDKYKAELDSSRWKKYRQRELKVEDSSPFKLASAMYLLGNSARYYNNDLSIEYCQKALDIYTGLKNDSMLAKSQFIMSNNYLDKGLYPEAESYLLKAQQYFEKEKVKRYQIRVWIKFVALKRSQGKLDEALNAIFKAKTIQEENGNTELLSGEIYYWIVLIYNRMQDPSTALKYAQSFTKAENETKYNNDRFFSSILIEAAHCQLQLKNINEAEILYKRLIPYKSKSKLSLAAIYSHLSNLYSEKNDFEKALLYIDSSIINSDGASPKFLAAIYNQKYTFLKSLGREEEGKAYPIKAIKLAEADKSWNHLSNALEISAGIYYKEKNYKEAFLHLKRMDSVKSFLHSNKMALEVRALEQNLIEEKKQKEIVLLQAEKSQANILRNIMTAMFGLSLITAILLYRLLRQRSKYNQQLEEKNQTIEKALKANKMLMKEIHHRVKNNLQVVSSLLGLQSRYIEDGQALDAIKTGRSRVQSMSILHQNLYKNDTLKNVEIKKYFEDLGQNLFNNYHIDEKEIKFNTDIDNLELDVDTVIPMGLITNELISNALKHAFTNQEKGEILLSIKMKDNQIELQVKDNGKGLPFNTLPERSASLGIQLIKSFATKLEADVRIINNNGMSITFTFNKNLLISKSA